jgi:hypothetical protein
MRWFACLAILAFLVPAVRADEREELAAKQKETALKHLTKAGVANPAVVETADLLVAGGFPEAKLKTMGDAVQKYYTAAFKALKFEMTDSPPKGKLTIYFFPERKQYILFVGEVQSGERVDKDERSHMDARGNDPYVAVTVLPGEKPIDLEAEASAQVPVALLQCKAGPATLPYWMKEGFARATQMRNDPKLAGERAKLRKMLYETKVNPSKYKAADAWAPGAEPEKKLLAAGVMDYFAYGPGAAALPKLLGGLRDEGTGAPPKFDEALKSADLDADKLDKALKKYMLTGK